MAPATVVLPRSLDRLSFRSFLRLVPANELPAKREKQARSAEAASMSRRDAQLSGDLTKRHAETAKAMHRGKAVQATVPLGMCAEFIHKRKLAIAPHSGTWKYAFDERP